MLHARQLWARPPPAHTGWFKQLTRSHLHSTLPAHTAASARSRLCPLSTVSQLVFPRAAASTCTSLPCPPSASLHRHFSTSDRLQAAKRRRRSKAAPSSPPDLAACTLAAELFRVGIFGRPNVGKSTLFNRLVGRHVAITDSTPGVTRDPLHHPAQLAQLHFTVVDTAGLEPVQSFLAQPPSSSQLVNKQSPSASLQQHIQQQTRRTVRQCHVALFLIDARLPLTNEDIQYARMVREEHYTVATAEDGGVQKQRLPVVLVANKAEEGADRDSLPGLTGAYQLGLGEPIELSAEHGEGLAMLHNVLDKHMQALAEQRTEATKAEMRDGSDERSAEVDRDERPLIQMAIVGRPNTGKSTLLNALLGEERALTGPQPGITRDAIRSLLPATSHPSHRFHVVDTAGIRGGVIRREGETRVDAEAMRMSMRAIDRANIVLLVLDVSGATQLSEGRGRADKRWKGKAEEEEAVLLSKVSGLVSQQDLSIAQRVVEEGRGLVVAVNKVDLLSADDKHDVLRGLRLLLDRTLPQVKEVPLIPLSATTQQHLPTLLPSVVWLYERWCKSVPTTRLTNWLLQLQTFRPHPSYKGKRIRLKFMRQVSVRPPTFSVWVGRGKAGRGGAGQMEGVSEEWLRMMRGMLCQEFGLEGVNIRVKLRRGEVKDREDRREAARDRDDKEERERVRQSAIEVEEDEEELRDVEEDEDDADEYAEMEAGEEHDTADVDVDAEEYRLRAAEELEEAQDEEGALNEAAVDEADVDEAGDDESERSERSLQSSPPRRPRFVPFEFDPQRVAAVAAATATVASSRSNTLQPVPGFMSPSPLPTASSSALSLPSHRGSSHSHLSFLPLPPPQPSSASLSWGERRVRQQKRTLQRSTAIRSKKEQAQFVSVAAWHRWKESQDEKRQKYLRKERKKVAGRERKAAGGRREQDVRVIAHDGQDEGDEDRSERSRVRDKRGAASRGQRRYSARS